MKKVIMFALMIIVVVTATVEIGAVTPVEVASHYAPVIYQDVDTKWESHVLDLDLDEDNSGYPENGVDDFITKFDFDGDWKGDNNWENLTLYERIGLEAYLYWAVTETATHWFILYGVYHPRDWDDEFSVNWFRFPGITAQHENDMEGILFVVKRDGTNFGVLQAIVTMAHYRCFNYPVISKITTKEGFNDDRRDKDNVDRPKMMGTHPVVYIQSEGHGIFADELTYIDLKKIDPFSDEGVYYWEEKDGFPNDTGIVYIYKGRAERAIPIERDKPETRHQVVGYDLVSFAEFWERKDDPETIGSGGAFVGTADGYDDLNPESNNTSNDNCAHAPWGWRELVGPMAEGPMISEPGEIWFDPARFFARRFSCLRHLSFAYTENNPRWVKEYSQMPIHFWVSGDSLGPHLVVVDKDTKPMFQVSWEPDVIGDDVLSACLLWNGIVRYALGDKASCHPFYGDPSNPRISGNLKYYISEDVFFTALIERFKRGKENVLSSYHSDTLWVKVKPHPTSFHVSQVIGNDANDGSQERPFATIKKALRRVSDYWEAPKKRQQTIVDTIFVGPGNYRESFNLDFPVHLIGSGPHKCAIGNPKGSIWIFENESGRKSSIQGFRLTQQIWAWEAKVDFVGNVFTPECWGADDFFSRCIGESAILIEDCSSYVEVIGNTFSCPSALTLRNSSPKIYNNLFTKRCNSAIWGRDSSSKPTIGGSASRANSFVGSRVFFTSAKPSAGYNWWGTDDPEVLERELGEHVYYSGYLKTPPENVGAQIPENELGDFNNDNRITITDFMHFVTHYGTEPGDQSWNPLFDLDFDGIVGFSDFQIFCNNYGNVFGPSAKLAIAGIVPQSKIPYLLACYPNPFNQEVRINFFLPKPEFVSLKVFNVLGQEVAELVNSSLVGHQTILWDGRNKQGRSVASGRYFIVLSSENLRLAKPVILLR